MKHASIVAVAFLPVIAACAVISTDEYAGGSPDAGPPASPLDGGGEASNETPPTNEAGVVGTDLGHGNGQDGEKTISAETIVNEYASVTATDGAIVDVEDAGNLGAGNAIMAWQTTSTESIAGSATAVDGYRVGSYELARIVSVSGKRLTLDHALQIALAAPGAQVVRMPEYTNLIISTNARLIGKPWDGATGGIVAVLVQKTFTINGTGIVDVTGIGFRGGISYQEDNLFDCDQRLDGTPIAGYAAKGEGLLIASYRAEGKGDPATAPGGRGPATVGGGGGACHNAGGGGGGNGGAGGQGGRDWADDGKGDEVGGLGGVALTYSAKTRLVLGGGGGAGDRHAGLDTRGGPGGGAVFIRADAIAIHGSIEASGSLSPVKTDHDGAGGGGAGGTIALFAGTAPVCDNAVRARGAEGASSTMSNIGPGGGGGGGHILIVPSSTTCPTDVSSGVAGVQQNAGALGGLHHGATPDTRGGGVVEPP